MYNLGPLVDRCAGAVVECGLFLAGDAVPFFNPKGPPGLWGVHTFLWLR